MDLIFKKPRFKITITICNPIQVFASGETTKENKQGGINLKVSLDNVAKQEDVNRQICPFGLGCWRGQWLDGGDMEMENK